MKKLYVSDLDGTLLNKDHMFDEVILDTIKEVVKSNNYFCIATGRHMHPSERFSIDNTKYNIYVISMNGAIVKDTKGDVVFEKHIDKSFIERLIERFPEVCFEFINKTNTLLLCSFEEYKKEFKTHNAFTDFLTKGIEGSYIERYLFEQSYESIVNQKIYKLGCQVQDEEIIKKINEFLIENEDCVVNASYDSKSFEITDKSVNKGNAVKVLSEILNVSSDDIHVFGDGANDVDMLEMFENSYSPSNASDLAKNAAKNIIGNSYDYSVSKHILELIKSDTK